MMVQGGQGKLALDAWLGSCCNELLHEVKACADEGDEDTWSVHG